MTGRSRVAIGSLVALALAISAGCNGILGIENAEVDPTFVAPSATSATSADLCDAYCKTIQKNCTGRLLQYLDEKVCLAMCPNFEPGTRGAQGASIACRLDHAELAATKPQEHCAHAGALGLQFCGNDRCAAFCLQTLSLCKGAPAPYGSQEECNNVCKGEKDAGPGFVYLPNLGDIADAGGDTLNCRLFHLESAYVKGFEATHCPHTGKVSATCR